LGTTLEIAPQKSAELSFSKKWVSLYPKGQLSNAITITFGETAYKEIIVTSNNMEALEHQKIVVIPPSAHHDEKPWCAMS
jgi:hypothetical protein